MKTGRKKISECINLSVKREVGNAILHTKGKDVLPLFQYATNIYECLLTVVALYICHEVITVR